MNSFSVKEIKSACSNYQEWHEFVRRKEAEIIFDTIGSRFKKAIELGAGDGGQSVTISRYCDELVCTEKDENGNGFVGKFSSRNILNVEYMLCDAENLSRFKDESFDLVFSSNMLEHVPNLSLCLNECKRVSAEDGLIVHVVPTITWKITCFLLSLVQFQKPLIHGVSRSHLKEVMQFSKISWRRQFNKHGFYIQDEIKLPFTTGHGIKFPRVVILGNALGFSSTTAFVLRNKC